MPSIRPGCCGALGKQKTARRAVRISESDFRLHEDFGALSVIMNYTTVDEKIENGADTRY
jgi:hypothetical protein